MIDTLAQLRDTPDMSDSTAPTGITREDWGSTPLSVRALVLRLVADIESLEQRLAALEERLNLNSQNSSQPPSADAPHAPARPTRPPSGRKAGGQPGHPPAQRPLKLVAEVERLVELKPTACGDCGALLLGADPQPQRHQVTEVPRIVPTVTEYRRHTLTCLACGAHTQAAWPSDMPLGDFGPRLQATTAYLSGRMGMSQRDVAETLATVFHTEVALGSISTLEATVSAALAQPVAAAQSYVQQQPANNTDETGWHEKSKRAWLWVCATPLVTLFLLTSTRGATGLKQLLGDAFPGVVGSDRWSAYNWLNPSQRQLCWAHLKRDFQKLAERGGESTRIGQSLLEQVEQVFQLWHRVRDGTLSRPTFQTAVEPIRTRLQDLLREGTLLSHTKTAHTCANMLKLEAALWTFVCVAGVEPTNNAAERPLRRAVLWRRRSFGTQSKDGSLFVERILTAVTTLRQQQRDVLDYLTTACTVAIRGETAPSLLPTPTSVMAVPTT